MTGECPEYNSLLQLTRATVSGGMDMEYRYTAGQNNGRIAQSKDWIAGEEVTYAYDSLQRLISAQTTGPEWGNSFSYDGFGNLTGKTVTKGSAPLLAQAYDPATNRPVGQSFDLNGNAQVGTWDIENRLVSQTLDGKAIQWGYDPDGKRVMRYETDTVGNPKWTFYLYGLSGEKLGSVVCTQAGYACARESANVYFGGKLVATMDAAGTYSGIVTDRLGSVRATKTGGTWTQTNYYAWGEEKSPVSADGKTKYATYTRDSTLAGQDYADQRYYSNVMGRFFSPDPAARRSSKQKEPASWNQYSYTAADPVNYSDPSGADGVYAGLPPYLYWGATGQAGQNCGDNWMFDSSLSGPCNCPDGVYGFDQATTAICIVPLAAIPVMAATTATQPTCDQLLSGQISTYLTSRGSPLAALADRFVADGRTSNVDPRFLVALSRAESTWGTNLTDKQGPYNAWSVSTHYGVGYSSFSEALDDVAKLLGTDPRYIRGNNITARGIYTVYNATFDDKYFQDTVVADMNKLFGNTDDVRFPCQ
jgi:RHS repeat-associated protein